jgi:hypothetical protein
LVDFSSSGFLFSFGEPRPSSEGKGEEWRSKGFALPFASLALIGHALLFIYYFALLRQQLFAASTSPSDGRRGRHTRGGLGLAVISVVPLVPIF